MQTTVKPVSGNLLEAVQLGNVASVQQLLAVRNGETGQGWLEEVRQLQPL